jgi:hypothetical protein
MALMFNGYITRLKEINLQRLSRMGAILGGAALLFALVVYLVDEKISSLVFGGIVVGVLGIGAWVLVAPQEVRDWISGRQVYYGTGTFLIVTVLVGVAAIGYSMVSRENVVLDLTPYGTYTLDPVSVSAIGQIKNRLDGTEFKARIVGFYPREEQRERALADIILSQYVAEGDGYIEVVYYDPDESPIEAQSYGYGISAGGFLVGPLFLVYVDKEGNPVGGGFEVIGEANERDISTALVRLSRVGEYTVYFTSGHIEHDPTDSGDFGVSIIYDSLVSIGINVQILNLPIAESVPEDADALIIAGPAQGFSEADVAKLDAYLRSGGHIMITSDPPYIDDAIPTSVSQNEFMVEADALSTYLWDTYGVRFRDDVISDRASSVGSELNILIYGVDRRYSSLTEFPSVPIIFLLGRSIETKSPEELQTSPYRIEELLFTSPESFGERGNPNNEEGVHPLRALLFDPNFAVDYTEGFDTAGPLYTAVAIKLRNESDFVGESPTPRLVLVGDTDWIRNINITGDTGATGNAVLWSRLSGWLLDEDELILPETQIRNDRIPATISDREETRIWLVTLGLLPGVVLAVGVLVWGSRQRR